MRIIAAAICTLVSLTVPGAAETGLNPNRPVRIVVPFAPGGSNDVVARLLAQSWEKKIAPAIVVENKTGAGGNIGTEFAAKAEADGHTLLVVANQITMYPVFKAKPNYHPLKDFVPVAKVGSQPVVLVVSTKLPVSSFKEFVELARKRSETEPLTFGSPGFGSPHHVFFEQMLKNLNIKMVHVPFRGIAPAVTEVVAGRIDMTFATENSAASLAKAGNVTPLAVLGPERVALLPDVPTSAEQGYPEVKAGFWYALLAPASTPAAIVERYNKLVNDDLATKEFQEALLKRGIQPDKQATAAAFGTLMKSEMDNWQKLSDQGLSIDSN